MSRPKGIPKTGGRVKGSVNKTTPLIKAVLLREMELTVQSTAEAIRRGCTFDIRSLLDDHGNFKAIHELTEEQAACISAVEVIVKNAEAGDGHTDRVLKVRFVDRAKYLEMAGKYLGMFIEKHEHTFDNALIEKLLQGRQRARGALTDGAIEAEVVK